MAGRRKAKRQAPGKITGVEEYLFHEQRTELVQGGQRPLGGMEYRRSKALPQDGQSKVTFVRVADSTGSSPGKGESLSFSSNSRRAARSRRWDEPKKPK